MAEWTSAPTTETGLALEAVDLGDKGTKEFDHISIWAAPTVPTVGPETYLEVLEGLLGRQGMAVTHCGGKDTDSRGPQKIFFVSFYFVVAVFFLLFFFFVFSF